MTGFPHFQCKFRIIPEFELNERLVGFVQTLWGRAALVGLFDAILIFKAPHDGPLMALCATLCAFAGPYRYHAVALSTILSLLLRPFWFDQSVPVLVAIREGVFGHINFVVLRYLTLAAFFVFAAAVIVFRRRFPSLPPSRRPIVSMTVLFLGLVLLAHSSLLHGTCRVALWSFVYTFSFYFWYLAYALADQAAKDRSPVWVQLATLHAFWSFSVVPLGKGAGYLRRTEAKNPSELAVTQIKGMKLLLWGSILSLVLRACRHVLYDMWHVPTFEQAFAGQIHGMPYARHECWESLVADLVLGVLDIAAGASVLIACGRIAGFRMLRNTYKPLSSGTVLEFWNRYFFYFKEAMVEFFFFPSFIRYFRNNKRLRMVFATFMAAGAGNLLFHFVTCIVFVEEFGLLGTAVGFENYAFYCLLLSAGIIASQLQAMKKEKRRGWFHDMVLTPLTVAFFFCILRVFNFAGDDYSLWMRPFGAHWTFLIRLFGFS